MTWRFLIVLICSLFWGEAFASSGAGLASYSEHIETLCSRWNVPPKLVYAIAKVESGHNLWAVNVAGKSYMPTSKSAALATANAAFYEGRSVDIGIMQINSYWLRRFGFTPEYVIDPERNLTIGIWILSKELERYGLSWRAVASYHTPVEKNPERGRRYAMLVIDRIKASSRGK